LMSEHKANQSFKRRGLSGRNWERLMIKLDDGNEKFEKFISF
jgi:hypothetical protein